MNPQTLCCFFIVVCISFVAANETLEEIGKKAEQVCNEKYNFTEEQVKEDAKSGELTDADYCYTGCTMLEEGAIKADGQFDKESTDAILDSVEDEKQREGMREFMYALGEDLANATDICSAGKIGLEYMMKLEEDEKSGE